MSDECDPVTTDEHVLRQIHTTRYDPSLPVPVIRTAFEPNKNDRTGISVFRERFTTAAELATYGSQPGCYYVARLSVRDMRPLGLTVIPAPVKGGLPGHAVIPELNSSTDKRRSKELQRDLAKLASLDIVCEPTA